MTKQEADRAKFPMFAGRELPLPQHPIPLSDSGRWKWAASWVLRQATRGS